VSDVGLYAGVAVAGAIGAPARYLVDGFVQSRHRSTFPYGTLLINASGALVLGFITGLVLYHAFPRTPQVLLGTGFCGAFTTFSTFTFETARLAETGERGRALVNVVGSVAAGTLAAALGLVLASL
jgi:fluoride exporter